MAIRRLKRALAFAALLLGGLGCEGEGATSAPAQSATYVGTIEGTRTRIAVVREGDAVQAYVCGEGETLASHTRWFEGELSAHDAGSAELESDGWRLTGLEGYARLRGELIAPDGQVARWQATRVAADAQSAIGLYDSHELGCRAGVIVWQDAPCLAQGAWCDGSGEIGQITPADCPAGGTLRVNALRGGEPIELTVERVEGPR